MKKLYPIALSVLMLGACVHGDGTVTDPLPSWGEVYTCTLQENDACPVMVPPPTCTDDPGALEEQLDTACLAHACYCVFDCTHHNLLPCVLK